MATKVSGNGRSAYAINAPGTKDIIVMASYSIGNQQACMSDIVHADKYLDTELKDNFYFALLFYCFEKHITENRLKMPKLAKATLSSGECGFGNGFGNISVKCNATGSDVKKVIKALTAPISRSSLNKRIADYKDSTSAKKSKMSREILESCIDKFLESVARVDVLLIGKVKKVDQALLTKIAKPLLELDPPSGAKRQGGAAMSKLSLYTTPKYGPLELCVKWSAIVNQANTDVCVETNRLTLNMAADKVAALYTSTSGLRCAKELFKQCKASDSNAMILYIAAKHALSCVDDYASVPIKSISESDVMKLLK